MDENSIVNAFVEKIKAGISGLMTVEAYNGTVAEAMAQMVEYPSVLVLLESVKYDDGDESGELLEATPVVNLLIGNASMISQEEAQKGAYDIMKSCRQLLHNSDLGLENTAWKIMDQRLVDISASVNVFGQRYKGENIYFD